MSIGIEAKLCERALRLKQPAAVAELLGQPFILAGGAMRPAEPRDFDIYGVDAPIILDDVRKRCLDRSLTVLDTTGNAVTVLLHDQLVQFCRHHKATPIDLVKSFDFSHVQAGVVFNRDGSIDQVVFTTAFKNVEECSYTPEYLVDILPRLKPVGFLPTGRLRGFVCRGGAPPPDLQILPEVSSSYVSVPSGSPFQVCRFARHQRAMPRPRTFRCLLSYHYLP